MPSAPNVYMGPLLFLQALQGQLEGMLADPNVPGMDSLNQSMSSGMKMPLTPGVGGGVQSNVAGNRTAGAAYGSAASSLVQNNMQNKDFLTSLLGGTGMGMNNILSDYYRIQQQGMSDPGGGGFMDILQGIF